MTVQKPKAPKWVQAKEIFWIKLLVSPPVEDEHGLRAGTIHRIIQHLEYEGRNPGGAVIKIRGGTGKLIGLCRHEFEYCTEQGEMP